LHTAKETLLLYYKNRIQQFYGKYRQKLRNIRDLAVYSRPSPAKFNTTKLNVAKLHIAELREIKREKKRHTNIIMN
jgi:hypothetical protein